ncbi:hypothetical protein [Cytophaga aurantiaca]|uniref:hypothetical protein n=1 Tax=Cytophaga aurantiaca TaxID=29530 RepID=UPI00036463FB|nr:hypothetical protein [Cytophaga aurantiaca]
MKLDEIILKFENRSYDVRMDFIEEYDFKDNYRDYYHNFILQALNIKNHLYLSDLIDLAAWLKFYDKKLYDRYFSYLFESRHYVVKLAALDYLLDSSLERKGNQVVYEKMMLKLISTNNYKVIYNQVLMNLIALHNKNEGKYIEMLLVSIEKTNDWRSIYRIINIVHTMKTFSKNKKKVIGFIKGLAEKNEYPEGVIKLLEKS